MLKRGWKSRWIAALRSGKYKQGRNALAVWHPKSGRIKGYCCLGVLARIEGAKFYGDNPFIKGESVKMIGAEYLDSDWCGGGGLSQATQEKLGSMNDDGKSFIEIAAWIKKNVKVKK